MRALAVVVLVTGCLPQDDDTCVPELSFGGSSKGPLYMVAMKVPMQISFSIPMDRTAGTMEVERWSGTAWQPQPASMGLLTCSQGSPVWKDDVSFDWYPSSFDTCTMTDQHWPEGAYFRWKPRDFRSLEGCVLESSRYPLVYFDTCRFDSQDHCTGVPFPPDYQ